MNADLTAFIFSRCPHAHLEECGKRGERSRKSHPPPASFARETEGGPAAGRPASPRGLRHSQGARCFLL